MEALIKITENNGKKVVSARDLYEGLGFKDNNFTKFCTRHIIKNEYAIQNADYQCLVLLDEMPNGGVREMTDYALTVDFAKKICMVARTEKGEQIRNYFIEVEKQSIERFAIPQSFSEALMLAAKQVEIIEQQQKALDESKSMLSLKESEIQLKEEIINHHLVEISHKDQELKVAAPKANIYDAHISSKETLTTSNIAMELGMSAKRLNKLLEDRGVQRKVNGIWTLNAKYSNHNFAVLKPYIEVNQVTGESKTYYQMVWTAKGRIWIKENVERIKESVTI